RDPLYRAELHDGYPWNLLRQAWPGVRYVVVSSDRRALLAELLGLAPERIAVVTPGVDLAAFLKLEPETVALAERLKLLRADPLLLLPARITRRKNIELAIQIVGALRQLGLRPRLVVTGPPGPHNPANVAYLAQLQALREATGAHDSIVFLYEQFVDEQGQPRAVTDTMLADLYRLADGLLFPSAYEGFGIPIIEAALAGIPIFCSDIAPFRETAGVAALRFGLQDRPAAIAARMATALRDDPRVVLRRRVRLDYTWEAIYRHAVVPLLAEPA
ncbi:MAG TPA: glycosyltransferase, partial [Roseiflexaceae bacterium]